MKIFRKECLIRNKNENYDNFYCKVDARKVKIIMR